MWFAWLVLLHGQAVQLAKKATYKPIIVEMMLDPQLWEQNAAVFDATFCTWKCCCEAPGREGQQLVGFAGWCTGAEMYTWKETQEMKLSHIYILSHVMHVSRVSKV